ncbi:hypothetical protein HC928_12650 [bacterium]|nr:hypothetical protein [bacterium]
MASYRVTITRNYGPVSVTLDFSNVLDETMTGHDAINKINGAAHIVTEAHRLIASEHVPKMGTDAVPFETKTNTAATVPITKITKRTEGGKVYIRAHGGAWQKWGVPVYEAREGQDWITHFIRSGGDELPEPGRSMIVEVVDGKPKRVTAFIDNA